MKATLAAALVSATAFSFSAHVLCHPAENRTLYDDDYGNKSAIEERSSITSMFDGQKPQENIDIILFGKPNCQGSMTKSKASSIRYGNNNDAPMDGIASVSISRDLMNNEQIDFSIQPKKKRRSMEDSTIETQDTSDPNSGTPTLEDRTANKHCSQFIGAAPAAPTAMTKGM